MIDNYDLFVAHDRKQAEWLEKLPVCDKCKNPIQQEKAVYYNDQWICEDCEEEFWKDIRADFLEYVTE